MRRFSRLLGGLLVLASVLSAQAHSTLERSEPKDGAILKSAPNELRIWFTEPIKVGLSTIEVRNAANQQVDQRDFHSDPEEPALVHLSLGANLAPGLYRVAWTAVAQDMHVAKGRITFQVAP